MKENLPCTCDQAPVEYCIRVILVRNIQLSASKFTEEELCTRLRVTPTALRGFLSKYTDVEKRPDIINLMRVAEALDVRMIFNAEIAKEGYEVASGICLDRWH